MSRSLKFAAAAFGIGVAGGVAVGAHAATLTLNDSNCTSFQMAEPTPGSFTLTCIAGAQAPVCNLVPSTVSPVIGGTLTLTANCTQNPTTYTWTNCSSTTSTCQVSSQTAGAAPYGVTAANATGTSPAATVAVTWVSPNSVTPPTGCIITPNPVSLGVGGGLVSLTVNCGGGSAPTSYTWSGGGLGNGTNQASLNIGVTTQFSVTATNSAGSDTSPTITVPVSTGTGGGGTISCAAEGFASTRTVPLNWSAAIGNVTIKTSGFGPGTAVVVPFTTPAVSKNSVGNINVFETTGLSTFRTVTLSSEACGRGTVYQTARGYTAPVYFVVGGTVRGYKTLAPGTTYYVTIANQYQGSETCGTSACDATIELIKP